MSASTGTSSGDHTPPGEPRPFDGADQVNRLRVRLAASMFGAFIVLSALAIALVAAGPATGGQWSTGVVVGLTLIGVAVPAGLGLLARRITEPALRIEDERRRLAELYEWARLDALRDALTGLGNQRAFEEELSRWVERNRRDVRAVALVLIDLDNLKSVNDTDGHDAGDDLLSTMGRLIAASIRRGDLAFRIGGDEFALLLPGADGGAAHQLARRLLANALEGQTADLTFTPFSFSAGVSAFPQPSSDGLQLRRHADAALYWSKRHGRTSVELFDPGRQATAGDSRSLTELSEAVTRVVDHGALRAHYQPIFDLVSGVPIGFEGLVRPTQDSGFPDVSALFVAAEAVGRTVELDLAAVGALIGGARTIPEDCYISLNVSPRTVESSGFSSVDVTSILARHGISPRRVVLELTEREAVEDIERLRLNLAACRAAGMRIAVDDVGAGNAGLRLLSQITFDIVKVDLSLVQRGILGEAGLSVLRALSDLAGRWGATVVAEGVETPQHLDVVRSLGLHAAQGYLLARPSDSIVAERVNLDAIIERWQYGLQLEEGRPEFAGSTAA